MCARPRVWMRRELSANQARSRRTGWRRFTSPTAAHWRPVTAHRSGGSGLMILHMPGRRSAGGVGNDRETGARRGRRVGTDHRPPTTDHRPPATGHRPPTTDHRPPAVGGRVDVAVSRGGRGVRAGGNGVYFSAFYDVPMTNEPNDGEPFMRVGGRPVTRSPQRRPRPCAPRMDHAKTRRRKAFYLMQ